MNSLVRFCTVQKICTRSISRGRNLISKESRMLNRMLKKKLSQKKTEYNVSRKLKQEVLSSAYDNEGTNRKITALNKHYMEQLFELISCGPFASQVTELGIEFTKVKLTSCRSSINVYWISSKPETPDSQIAEVLKCLKKDMQAQMGFLITMRKIPFITFVRDLRLEKHNIVEKLLEVADFGNDYQPTTARKVVNPESNELRKPENAENLEMRQDVLGLDHAKIKEKLMQNIHRFQPINIKKNELEEITQYDHPGKLAVFSKQLFTSFYRRKLFLDKKLRTREYDDSFIELDRPYDPKEEAEKYWEFLKLKDDLRDKEEEVQDNRNLFDDSTGEEDDDDYYEERDIDDNGWDDEDDNGENELGKGVFNEKNNKP